MLSARNAAVRLRCAPDYIGKLCREGKLKGQLIDQAWFVELDSIVVFESSRVSARALRAQELSTIRKEELTKSGFVRKVQPVSIAKPAAAGIAMMSLAKAAFACAAAGAVLFGSVTLSRSLSTMHADAAAAVAQVNSPFFGAQLPTGSISSFHFGSWLASLFAPQTQTQLAQQMPSVEPTTPKPIATTTTAVPAAPTTIVRNTYPVVEHTVERVVATQGVSENELAAKLQELTNSLTSQIYAVSSQQSNTTLVQYAAAQHIDNLSNVSINGASITGSTIDGYLPTSGGTLTGALTVTASATSSISGGLAVTGGCVSVNGVCITPGSSDLSSAVGVLAVAQGGTGTSTAPSYGQLLLGNNAGGYDLVSTSSLGIVGGSSTGFSTTSADYYVNASSTIAKTYTDNTFTGINTFVGAIFANSTTTNATSTTSFVSALFATNATTTNFFSTVASTTNLYAQSAQLGSLTLGSALTVANGGTGTSTAPSYGQLLLGNALGGYDLVSTSSLGIVSGSNGFSTTSADYWKLVNNFFSTTSADYYKSVNNYFSTTSSSYFLSQNQGNAFSTTSAQYFVDASSTIPKTYSNNTFTGGNIFANTTSTNATTTNFFATTASSTNLFASNFTLGSLSGILKATNGAVAAAVAGTDYENPLTFAYPLVRSTNAISLAFGTTTNNTWAGTQAFTNLSATTATTTNLAVTGVTSSLLKANSLGQLIAAVAGTDYANFGYLFPGNATSTPLAFNGGLTSFASSTIGDGTQTGGLTVNGGATTTGNAYIAGTLGIGTNNPGSTLEVRGSAAIGDGTNFGTIRISGGRVQFGSSSASPLDLIVGGALTALSINNVSGNVGIGTTSPYAKFSVVGQTVAQYFTATSTSDISTLPLLTATTATTTNLAVTGVTSSLLKTNSLGQLVAAVAGTDYANFGYLFPSNATSTLLAFNGGLTAFASSTIGNGTVAGGLTINGGATTTGTAVFSGNARVASLTLPNIASCVGASSVLQTDASGNVSCGTVTGGGASSAGGWTTNNIGRVALSTTTDLVVVGATSTPYGKLTVSSGSTATTTLVLAAVAGQTADIIHIYDQSGALATRIDSNGGISAPSLTLTSALGIAYGGTGTSTAPSYGQLLVGNGSGGYQFLATSTLGLASFSTTSAQYFVDASSTIPKTYSNNTFTGGNIFANSTTTNATTTNFYISGALALGNALGVTYGGTGTTSAPSYGQLLVGNGAGGYQFLATTSIGINSFSTTSAQYFVDASTTIPKTYSTNTFTGLNTFNGNTVFGATATSASIMPAADNTYSLGSTAYRFKDLYLGPGSLFVNNQEVIHTSVGNDVVVSSDPGQNLIVQTSSGGNVELNPTGSGQILVKNTINLTGGKSINTSDNSALSVPFGVAAGNITVSGNAIAASNLNGGISLTPNGNGGTYVTAGNFGIGTTSPTNKLEVNGNAFISGVLALGSALGVTSGGTGWSNIQSGTLLTGNGTGALATTSIGSGLTLSGGVLSVNSSQAFSTTSADFWKSVNNFFSTTSTDYWLTTKTTDNLAQGSTNKYYSTSLFAADLAGTTTDALAEGSTHFYFTTARARTAFSGTYPITYNSLLGTIGLAFGTTTSNTWSGVQTFSDILATGSTTLQNVTFLNATGTAATTSNFAVSSIASGNLIKTTLGGALIAAVAGTDYVTPSDINLAYPFPLAGNGTSTLTQFNGGLTAYASSTISGLTTLNATSTNATTTNFFATTASSTNLFATAFSGGTVTAGLLTGSNFLALGSSTLQDFTFTNATGTAATTTNFFATTASSTNLFATAGNFGTLTGAGLSGCSAASSKLLWSNGSFSCGTDAGAGASENNWLFFNDSALRLGTTTNQVLIGASSTSTVAALEVAGSIESYATGDPHLAAGTTTADVAYATAVSGNLLFSAENGGGLRIMDIRNPKSPAFVGSYSLTAALSVAVAGKYAYVGDVSTGLNVLDVSNPRNPVKVGSLAFSETNSFFPYGIAVSGKYAFMTDFNNDAMQIVDVGDPTHPKLVGTYIATGGAPYSLAVVGKYAYLTEPGLSQIHILDISNPAAPALVGTYTLASSNPFGVYPSGKYLYVADAVKGFYILDISNVAAPTLVGQYKPDLSDSYYGVIAAGNYAYVADHGHNKALVIDTSNPASPSLVGTYALSAGSPMAVNLAGKYAVVSGYDGGVNVLDINGLSAPSATLGSLAASQATIGESLAVGGDITAGGGLSVGVSGIFSHGAIAAYVASSTAVNPIAASFIGGNVGIGTTSPYAALSVVGNGVFNGNLLATGTLNVTGTTTLSELIATGSTTLQNFTALNSTSSNATTTNFFATTASSTNLFASNFTLGSLSGILKATNGAVAAAVAGTDYENPLTFAYPLVRSTNAISLAFGTTTNNTWAGTQAFTNLSATTATTTNLAVTGVTSSLLKTNSLGQLVAAVAGTDYANFGYLFPGNATSTNLTFSNGLTVNGGLTLGTALTVANGGTGSTTLSGLLKGNGTSGIQTAVAGTDYVTPSGLAAAFPFTPATNFGAAANSTTTALWLKNGLQSSSTIQTTGLNIWPATSTVLSYKGQSLLSASSTSNSLYLGLGTVAAGSTGGYNTVVGMLAGGFLTTGSGNFFGGFGAGSGVTSGSYNDFIGVNAGASNTSGGYNDFMGNGAGSANTVGSNNQFIGNSAGLSNTTGSLNVAIGNNALSSNFAGTSSVAIGPNALRAGDYTDVVGIGNAAGYGSQTNDIGSIYLGTRTGWNLTGTQYFNTYLGYNAGYNVTSGYGNILIGASSSLALTTGSNNIAIGNATNFSSPSANNQLNIGNLLFGTLPATSSAFKLPTSGSLGVGTSSPFAKFAIALNNGDTAGTAFAIGSSTASATSTLFAISNSGIITTSLGSGFVGSSNGTLYTFASSSITAASSTLLADNNTFSGTNTFGTLTATTATTTNLAVTGVTSSLLKTNSLGQLIAAVAGTDYANFGYLFPSNATSTTLTFSGGLLSLASTTIGNGTAAGGLTVSGTATTSNLVVSSLTSGRVPFVTTGGKLTDSANLAFDGANLTAAGYIKAGNTTGFKLGTDATIKTDGSGTFTISNDFGAGNYLSIDATNRITLQGNLLANAKNITGISTASTTNLTISGIASGSLLKTTTGGSVIAAVAGTDYANFGYLFPSNATSTLLAFNGGLTSFASSTIGDGTQAGGLTISGGATTTGNAYIAGNLGIGTNSPAYALDVAGAINSSGSAAGYNIDGTTILQASSTLFTTAVGYQALSSNTTGFQSVAAGYQALFSNTTGVQNNAIGYQALYSNTTGSSNVANGSFALRSNTTGFQNTAAGMNALRSNTTGGNNTASGYRALYSNTTGVGNTALGYYAGYSLSSGSYNIALGQNVSLASTTGDQQLNIGNVLFGTGLYAGSSVSGDPVLDGLLGVGTSSPFAKFSIALNNGDTTGTAFAIGSSTASATTTLFSVSNTGTIKTSLGSGFVGSSNGQLYTFASSSITAASSTLLADNNTFTGTNAFGNLTATTATTTNLAVTGVTSSLLKTNSLGQLVAAVAGTDYSNFAFPFTSTTNFGATANSTSTAIWFQNGLQASSTSQIAYANIGAINFNATTSTSTFISYSGRRFLVSSTTGSNLGLGLDTLASVTGGLGNTAMGYQSLQLLTSGGNNAAFGYQSGQSITTGSNNTFFGNATYGGANNTSNATVVGYNAGSPNKDITDSTVIGNNALPAASSALRNTVVGKDAFAGTAGGNDNVILGYRAQYNAWTSATANTVIGSLAGYRLGWTNGTTLSSTLLGYGAGYSIDDGYGNIAIGASSSQNLISGSNNIALGNNTNFASASANNQLNIGNLLYGTLPATSTNFLLPTSGALGIGTSSPFAKLSIALNNGDTTGTAFAIGSSTASATTTLFSVSNTGTIKTSLGSGFVGSSNGQLYTFASSSITAASSTLLADNNTFTGTNAFGNLTATTATTTNLVVSSLTSGRVPFVTTGGKLTDSANLAFDGTNLTAAGFIKAGNTTGFKLGTDATIKTDGSGTFTISNDFGAGNYLSIDSTNRITLQGNLLANAKNITGITTASTTNLTISSIASGSLLKTTTGGSVIAAVAGTDYSNFAFPFTSTTNFGATANSTTTAIWFQAGLQASSTSQFADANIFGTINFATTSTSTLIAFKGQSFITASSTLFNTAVGLNALGKNTTGNNNTALGNQALQSNTTGSQNTATGLATLVSNTTGTGNAAYGMQALLSNSSGNQNSAFGLNALFSNTSGTNNTAIGFQAGDTVTTGYSNTLIGDNSAFLTHITSGSHNVGVGSDIFFPSATANNQLNIGNLLFGTLPATTSAFQLPTSGSLGVGTSSPFAKFAIALNNGDTAGTAFAIGSSTASATTTLFSVSNTGSTTIANGVNITAGCFAVNGTCLSTSGSSFGYLFPSNATSTLLAFNGGLTAFASSTIGNGTAAGGLTISGGATTTGDVVVSGTGTSTFAGNLAIGGANIYASNNGFAGGRGNTITGAKINASGIGSLAWGYANQSSGGTINASGVGSVALGLGVLSATNGGSIALGYGADSVGGDIISSGAGSFAAGYSGSGNVTASGSGSFAFGDNVTASNSYSTAFGSGFTNNLANTFQVGYSATPTFTVNATSVGIGTSSPMAQLSVFATPSTLNANNTIFAIGSSTAAFATTTLFTIDNHGILNLNPDNGGTSTLATAFGANFLRSDGSTQLGLGIGALDNASYSLYDIGIGKYALQNDTGGDNYAFGNFALQANTSGSNNVAVGESALTANISGGNNTAVGNYALWNNVAGGYNSAFGVNALANATSSKIIDNVAIGEGALQGAGGQYLTFTGNTVIGSSALSNATSGSYNVALGYAVGQHVSSGYSNILIGADNSFLGGPTTGAGNIGLGNNIFFPSATANNQLNIGGILYGTLPATSTGFLLPTSGALGVGTSSPFAKFSIALNNGDTTGTAFAIGSSTASATTTLFSISNTGAITDASLASLGCLGTDSKGKFQAGTCTGGSGTFSWTPTTNFGAAANSTSTPIWFQGGLQSSSTIQTIGLNVFPATSSIVSYQGQALLIASSSTNALGLGTGALAVTTGSDNLALGVNALNANTTGFQNVAVGTGALQFNTTGTRNTFIGRNAGIFQIGATTSVAVGAAAGSGISNSHVQGLTALGYNSGASINTGGDYNTLVGYRSGGNFTLSGYNNILVGAAVGTSQNISSGSGNIGIGSELFFASATANNQLNIGNFLFGTLPATSTGFVLPTSGALGVGTSSPFAKLSIALNNGDTTGTAFAIGSSTASATTTLFAVSNTGSTTIANGVNITAGCFAVNGTCITAGGGTASSTLLADNNTFTGANLFLASTTIGNGTAAGGLTINGTATTTALAITGLTSQSCLGTNSLGQLQAGTCTGGSSFSYPFPSNATSTALTFSGGLLSLASTTIGNGTAAGGLTINGGATTTGNAYITGGLGIGKINTNANTIDVSQYGSYKINGNNALYASTTNNSVVVGPNSGAQESVDATAQYNSFVGVGVGNSSSLTGDHNNALGAQAFNALTTGSNNEAVGAQALYSLTTGWNNVGVGDGAGYYNGTGSANVFMGYQAGQGQAGYNTDNNVGIGYRSLYKIANSGVNNTTLGFQSGYGITSGSYNIALGSFGTVDIITSGSNNILVGQDVQNGVSATASNQLNLGNLLYGTGLGSGTTLSTGNIGIGTTSPYAKLSVAGAPGGTVDLFALSTSTSGFATSTAVRISQNGNFHLSGGAGIAVGYTNTPPASGLSVAGNVGVGTTSPFAQLSVFATPSTLNSNNTIFAIGSSTAAFSTSTLFSVDNTGLTTIGNSSGSGDANFQYASDSNAWSTGYYSTDKSFRIASSTALSSNVAFTISKSTLNVGIGTTSPAALLTVVGGGACFSGSSATVACGNTAGNLYYRTANTGTYDVAENYLANDAIAPGTLVGISSGTTTVGTATSSASVLGVVSTDPGLRLGGADAENTGKQVVPIALSGRVPVTVNLEGGAIDIGDRITLSSVPGVGRKAGPLESSIGIALSPLATTSTSTSITMFVSLQKATDVAAIADALTGTSTATTTVQQSFLSGLLAKVGSWMGSAGNGIADLFAAHIHAQTVEADTVTTQTLCIGATCVTEDQLKSLLNGQTAGAAGAGSATTGTGTTGTSTDTQAPVITINGSNPTQIAVNASYIDLGATVTDNVDHNLGYYVSVDGGAATTPDQLHIDTSAAGTHQILYSATDQAGNEGYATRTVIVGDGAATSTTSTSTTSTSTPTTIATGTSTSTPAVTTTNAATSSPSTISTGTSTTTATTTP